MYIRKCTNKKIRAALIAAVMLPFSAVASDLQLKVYSVAPEATELVNILFPKKIRTRSLQVAKPDTAPDGIVAMKIQFEFDSDRLQKAAYPLLDSIAAVLDHEQSEGKGIVVEGHTDSVGDEGYNLQLSKRRASSVFDYLVTKHGIEPQRLTIRGFGEYVPLNSSDPGSAVNRRVQFKAAD